MNELEAILSDTVGRLFTDHVTDAALAAAEQGTWPDALWRALEEHGVTLPLVPEAQGGAGGSWRDAHVVARAAGRHAAPVPLCETLLGGWLLGGAALEVPPGPLTVAPVRPEDTVRLERAPGGLRVSGAATRVPWGRAARHVVIVAPLQARPWVALLPAEAARVTPGRNLALEPRDALTFEAVPAIAAAPAAPGLPVDAVWRYGALLRAAQMAGALGRALEESVRHVNVRVQFGRPLGRFQAIQQQLAVLAGEAAAAATAADAAFRAADQGEASFEIAVAKIRAGEAAGIGARIAHQVHGAIGFTYEHVLHFLTRRLWSWRAECGTGTRWAEELGRAVAARGAGALWPDLVARPLRS